jgi:two-component system cell cycle response regulator
MPTPRFDELKTSGKLPSPSGVALAIIDLCRSDSVSLDEIAHAVQADPALSGRLIKFANAAANPLRRPVVAVPEAIRVTGINTVRQLVLGFSLLGRYSSGTCEAFDYERFWSRSLAMAIAASALCARVRSAPPEEAFTCGLLASVGALALATIYPTEYADLLDMHQPKTAAELVRLEQEQFATDHNELGAALLEDWRLPKLYVVSAFHHEAPDQARLPEGSREFTVCNLLHVAALLSGFCVAREEDRRSLIPELLLATAKIGLDQSAMSKLSDEVVAQWRDWGTILDVKTQPVPSFDTLVQDKRETGAAAIAVPPTDASLAQSSFTVLVVDDERASVLLVEQLLRGLGHKVYSAGDGRTGLAMAMSVRPQIIVSDWIMPGLDGLSFCKALRQTEEGQLIYFIILSALEQDDQLVEAFESGVDDYLMKPFTPRVLAARLRAGTRVVKLQEEAKHDSENLRRFAAELAVANRRLQQAALTDPLTGLPNRRYGMERLEQEWAATARNQRPLSCLVVDIDQFKQINDTFGHDSGDTVLRQVAAVLRKEARIEDVVCRIGGEEFLVISPDTPLSAALTLAERLRAAVSRGRAANGTISHNTTVSIGVSQREPGMVRMDELIKAADNALYEAKRAGRDRVAPGPARAPSQLGVT